MQSQESCLGAGVLARKLYNRCDGSTADQLGWGGEPRFSALTVSWITAWREIVGRNVLSFKAAAYNQSRVPTESE